MFVNTTMADDSLVVLGHSFIQGTYQHLLGPNQQLTSSSLARKLNLEKLLGRVFMSGQHGAKACKTAQNYFTLPSSLLNRVQPRYAILELSTNDLAGGADPLQVATSIIDIANNLVSDYGVQQVTVSIA